MNNPTPTATCQNPPPTIVANTGVSGAALTKLEKAIFSSMIPVLAAAEKEGEG